MGQKMKKICFVTTIYGTYCAFLKSFATYLHETGEYDIYLICNEEDCIIDDIQDFVTYLPVKMDRGVSLSAFSSIRAITKIIKENKFDIVQYSTPNASLYASIAGKLAKIPVRLYCQWGMVFVGFEGIKRKIFKMEEKLVCKLSTWIEPDSNSNLNFAHSEGLYPENKGSVIWNGSASGVSLEKFDISKKEEYRNQIRTQYNIPDNAFVYGFVGRITRDKGINELLEAYRDIMTDNSYLMMVGNEELDNNINMELFNWSKNNDQVIYTGQTNVVEQYLSAMDVYILPSYREGFGSGVIEAEAMGLPVIVSDIPGPTDAMVKNETGLVVKKADIDSLKSAMLEIRNNENMRECMAEKAYTFAKDNFEQQNLFEYILRDRKRLLGE